MKRNDFNNDRNLKRVDENVMSSIGLSMESKSGDRSFCSVLIRQLLMVTSKEDREQIFKSDDAIQKEIMTFEKKVVQGSIMKSLSNLCFSVIVIVRPEKEQIFETSLAKQSLNIRGKQLCR